MSANTAASSSAAPATESVLSQWATSLCHHLAQHRPQAPIASVVPRLLAPAVERHVRTVIESAVKVQRRARRSTLTVDDTNFALAQANQEVANASPPPTLAVPPSLAS